MNRQIAFAAVLSVGVAFGQPTKSTHCTAPDPNLPQLMGNHEVPVIVEDGSIRVVLYKSHFDQALLSRIFPPPNTKVADQVPLGTTPTRFAAWHTHGGDHLLQIGVSQPGTGGPGMRLKTRLHQYTMLGSDVVELQLEQGSLPVDSVWVNKEFDSALSTKCHTASTPASAKRDKLAWVMRGVGVLKNPNPSKTIPDSAEFVNLEYAPWSNKTGVLRLRGVRIWSADPDPAKKSGAYIKAEFKLGNGCSAVQICPNDEKGTPVCQPFKTACPLQRFIEQKMDPSQLELQK